MTIPAIDYFSIRHPLRNPASRISFQMRKNIFRLFWTHLAPQPSDRVLDVGATPDRYLPESNFFERFYPYKNRLTVTSIEDASFLESLHPGLRFIQTGPEKLPFEDLAFDIVFCSAVIEHVGHTDRQHAFISELLRVSRRFFITTPNRQFPFEFHTFIPMIHWLPQPQHQRILRLLGLNFWAKTSNLNLLTPARLQKLFPDTATVHLIRLKLLCLPSNLIAWGNTGNHSPERNPASSPKSNPC